MLVKIIKSNKNIVIEHHQTHLDKKNVLKSTTWDTKEKMNIEAFLLSTKCIEMLWITIDIWVRNFEFFLKNNAHIAFAV